MTRDAPTVQLRTRPTPRIVMLALLALLVYAAGANVGAGTVLFLSAGMAVGTGWSVTGFLRRVGELRVRAEQTVVVDEGRGALVITVNVPRGVIGVIGAVPTLPPDEAVALLGVLGQALPDGNGEPAADRSADVAWSTLPRSGSTGAVSVRTVLARGDAQQLQLQLDLTDVFGLVRRRWTVAGPVAHVVPAHGAAAPFGAATVEGADEEQLAHALAANGIPGTELRPWRPGEAIRAVHWAASERVAQLLVRPRAPETRQRRTLAVEEGDWTRATLDARCRDLAATADRLVQAGVEVEVAAGGQVLPWGREARLLLAALPPNASTPASAGDTPPHGSAGRGRQRRGRGG